MEKLVRHRQTKGTETDRHLLYATAPVPDPTAPPEVPETPPLSPIAMLPPKVTSLLFDDDGDDEQPSAANSSIAAKTRPNLGSG